MKLVLVKPYYEAYMFTPTLGLGYISSYLKQRDIEVYLIDAVRDNLSNEKVLQKIKDIKPDAVGISCLSAFYPYCVDLALLIKEAGYKTIIGGVHPTFLPYQTLVDTKADYVICGEGEIPFAKLAANNFINNSIQGVYSLKDFTTPDMEVLRSEVVENLDDIPFPDWEQLRPDLFPPSPMGTIAKGYPLATMMSTRGCPYPCVFCSSPNFYQKKVRFRSPENVVDEMEYLLKRFKIKELQFMDDNLIYNREHAVRICNLILERGLKISWSCPNGVRADKLDKELAELMKKAGCYMLTFGIESSDPQVLLNIKKSETIDQIEKAIEIAHNAGLICQGSFVFGLPGDTKRTIEETIRFSKRTKLDRALFTIMDILPGCELWYKYEGQFVPNFTLSSFSKPNWVPEGLTENELLKFQSRAHREFYSRPRVFFNMIKYLRFAQIKFLLRRLLLYRII